jgi:hypothetical protein
LGRLNSVTAILPIRANATIALGASKPRIEATLLVELETPVSNTPMAGVLFITFLGSPNSVSQLLGSGTTLTGAQAAEFEGNGEVALPVQISYSIPFGSPVDLNIFNSSEGTLSYDYTPPPPLPPSAPEPASLPLVAAGAIMLAATRRRRC